MSEPLESARGGAMVDSTIRIDVADEWGPAYDSTVWVVLDPESRRVYTYCGVGGGWPISIYLRQHLVLWEVRRGYVGSTLQTWVEARRPEIEAILAAYRGTEWVNGSNHVGRWDLPEGWELEMEGPLPGDLGEYWDAGEYLWADKASTRDALLSDESIEAAVEREVSEALGENVALDRDQVREALRDLLEDLESGEEGYERAREMLAACKEVSR